MKSAVLMKDLDLKDGVLILAVLNLAVLFCLWVWLVWLMTRRKADISQEARKFFFRPLLFGLTSWVIERAVYIIPPFYAYSAKVTVFTSKAIVLYQMCFLVSQILRVPSDIYRFIAGRNLFRLQQRLIHDVQPVMPDPPFWQRLRAVVCSRSALIVVWILTIGPVILCILWIAGKTTKVPVDLVAYAPAGYSFLVLGAGLARELTRHKQEFVGLFIGLSVMFYGVIQFLAAHRAWAPIINILALFLKGMFAVAIASFWTMSRELTRASEDRPTMTVFKTRFLMDIHDALQVPDAISKFSDTAVTFLARGNIQEVSRYIGRIKEAARKQNAQLRDVLQSLQAGADVVLDGLLPSIRKLADSFSDEPPVVLQATGDESALTPDQKQIFYLVAREALRNALRHATNPTLVKIALDCDRKILTIEDDGLGAWPLAEPRQGSGTSMMRAGAVEIGASLDFEKCQPHGIRVTLEIPK